MGACRALVYFVAAFAVAGSVRPRCAAAAVLLLYIVGLTQVAKAEGSGIAAAGRCRRARARRVLARRSTQPVVLLLVAFVAWAAWALRLVRPPRDRHRRVA